MSDDAWIRRFHPGTDGGVRLVCLPHAGGAASYFHPLSATLAPEAETLAVQYPGRQDRRSEPPAASVHELADRIFDVLKPWADRPLALFGHSMGALVGYEVARRMEDRGDAPPAVLFASGRRAPSIYRPETVHRLGEAGVVDELKQLSGTDPRLLEDDELFQMILPALKADYAALDAYRPVHRPPLGCPVVALVGDTDPVTSQADARAWAAHTSGPFDLHVFSGGHFFLADHQAEVSAIVARGLRAAA